MTPAAAAPPPALTAHLPALEESLRAAVGEERGALAAAARYVMGWEDEAGRPASAGGKRIRPALCLLAAEALGGSAEAAMPGAVAVELTHNFSLVHDEIQDRDAERHHRPTVWRLAGEAQAINVGDFLFTRALRALGGADAPPERRVAAIDALLAAIEDMIGGQWADLSFEPRGDVSAGEYLAMVEGKTGALIGAPLQIGAILAGAPAALAGGIRDWGRRVGLAFQARDDILGIWGDPALTGKSNRNDLARRKKTLPVIAALSDPRTRDAVERLHALDDPPDDAIAALAERLEASGARARADGYARRYVTEADGLLDALGLRDDERAVFAAVARYLVERAG